MTERRIMPLFWPDEAYRSTLSDIRTTEFHPIPAWEGAFYSVTRLDSSELDPGALTFAQWRRSRRAAMRRSNVRLV